MMKKFLIILGVLMLILTIILAFGGYYAYQHRQELLQKTLNYAMQNMGSSFVNNTASKAVKENKGLENIVGLLTGNTESEVDLSGLAQQAISALGGLDTNKNIPANDINARDNKGRTLLMNVCRTDASAQVIKMLLQYGADVNATDNKGRTALMYATALNQNPQVLDLLIASGADYNKRDNSGKAVIDYAVSDDIRALLQKYLP